ncbi:NAD(P)-dependent dehydrogenase (short-subunit alcohol dehydrogenase family) [Bradyrhizobium sp. USDA 4369]
MRLSNKVCIVTGGASGIGAATAILFAREGAQVVVADIAATEAVVAKINDAGGSAIGVEADVSIAAGAERAIDVAVRAYGEVDILVNNAGIGTRGDALSTDEETWDSLFRVNVKSGHLCSRAAMPHLLKRGGVILFTASIAGLEGVCDLYAYCATKAAVINMARAMALDLARSNIRVNVVCPGATDTPMLRAGFGRNGVLPNQFIDRLPLGALVQPEDIADAFLFLASDSARSITGQVVVVDAGLVAGDFFMPGAAAETLRNAN